MPDYPAEQRALDVTHPSGPFLKTLRAEHERRERRKWGNAPTQEPEPVVPEVFTPVWTRRWFGMFYTGEGL